MKIGLLLPIHRSPRAGFVVAFANMLICSPRWSVKFQGSEAPLELELFAYSTSSIATSRNELARQALEANVDALLWCDDDHTFPDDALIRILGHGKPLVGINYLRRRSNHPVAMRGGQHVWTTRAKAEAGELEEVDTTGLGFCFMLADALRKIEHPYFDGPYEDQYLFAKLKAAGVPLLIDHALSWDSSHIGEAELTFSEVPRAS